MSAVRRFSSQTILGDSVCTGASPSWAGAEVGSLWLRFLSRDGNASVELSLSPDEARRMVASVKNALEQHEAQTLRGGEQYRKEVSRGVD